jgi:hypothetical protein
MLEEHVCVVVSDPVADRSRVVLFAITKWADYKDPACVFDPAQCGALDFVRVRSCIEYRRPIVQSLEVVESLVSSGVIRPKQPIPGKLLYCIRQGAVASRLIPRGVRKILLEQGLLAPQ